MATHTRVLVELIIHADDLATLLEALWWLNPEAIELEAHRYLLVVDVCVDDAAVAPGYVRRRLHKAATELGLTLATAEYEVVGAPAVA